MGMKIYFAHPRFTKEQEEVSKKLMDIFEKSGDLHEVLNPFDYSPNIEGTRDLKRMIGRSVVDINERLVSTSDLVVALIDDRDSGVIYEMGYAAAYEIPIITISVKEFDVNIMLSGKVMAHIQNVLEEPNKKNFIEILRSYSKILPICKEEEEI